MVLKLHGLSMSTCTRRVATILKEKEIPYELIQIDFDNREHKTEEYRKKQPFGQLPYIDDDGFILFESRAICRYIEAKYPNQGTKLIPTELKENALFEQAASIETTAFEPWVSWIAREEILKPLLGLKPDKARTKDNLAKLGEKLDGYEDILSKQTYLAGEEISMVDLFHLPNGVIARQHGPEVFSSRPHVTKWFESLESRPSWIAVEAGA